MSVGCLHREKLARHRGTYDSYQSSSEPSSSESPMFSFRWLSAAARALARSPSPPPALGESGPEVAEAIPDPVTAPAAAPPRAALPGGGVADESVFLRL